MTSFYYYDQNPWNLTGITKFEYETKNEKDSGRGSKMRPSCKWPIETEKNCLLSSSSLFIILSIFYYYYYYYHYYHYYYYYYFSAKFF